MSYLQNKTLSLLAKASGDRLTIADADNAILHAAGNSEAARIVIADRRAYAALMAGSVSAARAFIEGWWRSPDLFSLMRLGAQNIDALNAGLDGGWRRPLRALAEYAAAARRRLSWRAAARADIAAHYDLGNDFFSLFLDDTLAYSCAVFENPHAADAAGTSSAAAELPAAQRAKLQRVADKLQLRSEDRLLDMGCGWGAFAFHAARAAKCHTTALTLSAAQNRYLASAKGNLPVSAVLSDYRDYAAPRPFSKIASIEMIEAAGDKHFFAYFRRLRDFLAQDGRALVQAIVIPDQRYRAARQESDFIRRYVFPGGKLPSQGVIAAAAAAARLRIIGWEDIGAHYAPTLLAWRERFFAQRDKLQAMGFDDKFRRRWDFYFCYCAGAFAANALSCAQIILEPQRA